jgi:omega-6 fatty acid desaturase (delta-12 desaturase)
MAADKQSWKADIAPYARPSVTRSILDLLTSVVPFLVLMAVQIAMLNRGVAYWKVLIIQALTAGFLLRTFIVFHDCTHGSFLPTKRGNHILGAFVGLLVFTPFLTWRHEHAVHHATSGDLDRRGVGDVPVFTLEEYVNHGPWMRLGYRLFRNPIVMFGLGWIYSLIIQPRIVSAGSRPRLKRSTWLTNIVLVVVIAALGTVLGWGDFLLAEVPTAAIAGGLGVWLFYVQHQYEDVYWESGDSWTYQDAALRGSSYLKLRQPFQFFTGNIGLHHVHHLSARVPNYNLQAAHDANPIFHDVPQLSLWDGLKAMRLKLYDEDGRRLVTFAQARHCHAEPAARVEPATTSS